jgi:formylglycine-generating enzyme required for sulfatase activity
VTRPAERRPEALLVLAGAAIALVLIGVAIESADLFPRLRFAIQRDAAELPSTRAVPPRDVIRGLPLLSIYLQPEDLKEILANKMEHGVKWERRASLSFFDAGRLRFGGEAGVRIHGGGSRITSPRQGFRVFFRRRYGTAHFPPGIVFGPDSDPIKRIVVHNDVRRADGINWHLANPLAYDLARRVGGITPDTYPSRFFLNGEDQGLFVLTEHFDDEYFATHMPGRRITMEIDDMEALRDNLERLRPLTMDGVSAFMDLDNVTSWFLAVVFAGTRDAYQGPGQFLDEGRERGGWFWVTWDMDESFRTWDLDSFLYLLERPGERPRGRRASEPRSFVLTTLISEDARFRAYLAARIDTMLNHQLTREFVEERRAHYARTVAEFGVPDTTYLNRQKEFLEKRPTFVRAIAEQWLNTPPGVPVSIRRAGGGPLIVDGFEKAGAYDGTYFPGREVVARSPDGAVRWIVNGSVAAEGQELRIHANRPLTIVATTDRVEPLTEVPYRAAPAEQAPAPEPIQWRQIPPGSFIAGCTEGDTMCDDNERPTQQVSVPEFQLMAAEVTVHQYRAFAASSGRTVPRQPHWSGPDHPVVNLTWDEAASFCEAAGGRLPTEVEWEYAARGGRSDLRFTTGMQLNVDAVNGRGVTADDRWGMTSPVRSFPPGAYGLYDMAGNVWEWTASWFREDDEWAQPRASEPGPDSDQFLRTIRGGSWDSSMRNLRVSGRVGLSPHGRHNLYVGIRCARSRANASSSEARR